MNTLILVFHPDVEQSVINKRWIEELEKSPDKYVVRNLYKIYSDEKIDVEAEQKIIESFDNIIFQFPIYWFNCPPFMKKYLDDVLTYGWAYGSQSGYKLSSKKIGFAVTAGINEEDYSTEGRYKYTLDELLRPFEVTVNYVKADYRSFFAFYDIEQNVSEEWIESSVQPFINYVDTI